MSFEIRVSLKSPIKTTLEDRVFKITREEDARNLADIVMMILDRNYFDTYDDYVRTINSIGKILQGYEYSIKPYARLCSRKK